MQLKIGFETTLVFCQHASMADIVSAAFGGGPKPEPGKLPEGVRDLAEGGSFDMSLARINGALNWG